MYLEGASQRAPRVFYGCIGNERVCALFVFCARSRDFAYVARDKNTRVLKCHVFRCDTPAAAIATSLHEVCSKVGAIAAAST